MGRATVRLINRGEQHPYVIEVVTPGWSGCDHALDGTTKQTMPAELNEICDVLKKANAKYYSVSEPNKANVMMFVEDGSTEFVFRDATDFEAAVRALVRTGWLSPETHPTIQ
jgi:hypothetical protein